MSPRSYGISNSITVVRARMRSPIAKSKSLSPSPVTAENATAPRCSCTRRFAESGSRSLLFITSNSGTLSAPISVSTSRTAIIWPFGSTADASTTCTNKSLAEATSSVLLNASINPCGNRRTKPTVSESNTGSPPGNARRRVVGSRVANKRFSTKTPALVSRFNTEDLPAFV